MELSMKLHRLLYYIFCCVYVEINLHISLSLSQNWCSGVF